MFDSITAQAIVENARPFIEFLQAQEASITSQLWREYPLLMLAGAALSAIALWKSLLAPARVRTRRPRRR